MADFRAKSGRIRTTERASDDGIVNPFNNDGLSL